MMLANLICLFAIVCGQQVVVGLNQPPSFDSPIGDLSDFALSENTPIGSIVYQLKGRDPEHTNVFYSISGPEFTVDSRNGYVQLQRQLDREKQPELEVIVTIRDESFDSSEPNIVSLRRVIRVLDENDNKPRFVNKPFVGEIAESARLGAVVHFSTDNDIIVTDDDSGRNADLQISCHSNDTFNSCDIFEIVIAERNQICHIKCTIRIHLKSELDYETKTAYELYVKVTDRGSKPFTVFERIRINVRDEQDEPPVFLNAPYTVTISENQPPDTEVLTIIASDGDRTNKRPIYLEIENDPLNLFYLNMSSRSENEILLMTSAASARFLDRENEQITESNGIYRIAVRATEIIDDDELSEDFVRETVTIVVTDVDDQRAEFEKDFYEISIPENLPELSLIPDLKISVHDRDLEPNNRFNLTIVSAIDKQFDASNVFRLVPSWGEGHVICRLRLINASSLDYDRAQKPEIEFDIVAAGTVASRTHVRIRTFDVNDNRPIFERKHYRFEIDENAPIGFEVGRVKAVDLDSGSNGHVFYELLNDGNEFEIDRRNGSVRVKKSPDYETRHVYDFTVQARDANGQVSQRPATVQIRIRNINDNAPFFEQNDYFRLVPEKSTEFQPQFFIRAYDIDLARNETIRYSLIAINSERKDVFAFDRETGELRINRAVRVNDTLSGQYELLVQAADFGYPPLTNTTTVRVRVGIAGNQRPIFKANSIGKNGRLEYRVEIDENTASGTVILNVSAIDPDSFNAADAANSLSFEIIDGDYDRFSIDARTGVIRVANGTNLDLSMTGSKTDYSLLIQVSDGAEPKPETSTIPVQITVRDLNDKPPKFIGNQFEFRTINKDVEIGTILMQVEAQDPDSHSFLNYEIIEPIKFLDKNANEILTGDKPEKLLEIDQLTGSIRLVRKLSQDFEQLSTISMRIRAFDKNATKATDGSIQEDFKDLTIYVRKQRASDSQPIFLNNNWSSHNAVIRCNCDEELPIGTVIVKLIAFDPLNNRTIDNFRAIHGSNSSTPDLLSVLNNGEIVLTKRLDYENLISDVLELEVEAIAASGSSRTTITKVEIYVNNLNDNKPVFQQQKYSRKVPESLKYPEEIVTVRATDPDFPRFLNARNHETKKFGLINYSILLNHDNKFEINSTTGLLKLRPDMKLDRETESEIELIVQARDNGLVKQQTEVMVRLEIVDVNDNRPEFDRDEYTGIVSELNAIGTSVLNVTAHDPDQNLGGSLAFSISENDLFSIDNRTGAVRTKRLLNGKGRTEPYRFRLKVEDGFGLSAETNLIVYVTDIAENDGVPVIVRPKADEIIDVYENSEINSVIYHVKAIDSDSPETLNGQLVYRLETNGFDYKCFEIDLFTGLLRIKCNFDRESKSKYTFGIEVSDRGQPVRKSSRILHIRIADIDDNTPIFSKNIDNDEPIVFEIDEELPLNSSIGEIKAIDNDSNENSHVYFAIRNGNEKGLVKLEPKINDSKTVVLKVAGRIDREQLTEILLTIKCSKSILNGVNEKYDPKDRSEIQVRIRINDLDDNWPFFKKPKSQIVAIGSKTATLTLIETFQAMDFDRGQSNNFMYRLKKCQFSPKNRNDLIAFRSVNRSLLASMDDCRDNFKLDSKRGYLRTARNLKVYNDGHFNVTIEAFNGKSTFISIIILVLNEKNLLKFVYNDNEQLTVENCAKKFDRIRDEIKMRIKTGLETIDLKKSSVTNATTAIVDNSDEERLISRSSECFQMVDNETLLNQDETIELLANSVQFERIRTQFNISHLENCYKSSSIIQKKISFAQSMLLMTACSIAIFSFILFHLLLFMSRRLTNKSF